MKRDRNDTSPAAISVFFMGTKNSVHSLGKKLPKSYDVNGTMVPLESTSLSSVGREAKSGPTFARMLRKGKKHFEIPKNSVCVFVFDPTDWESLERIEHELCYCSDYFRYSDFDVQMLVSCTSGDYNPIESLSPLQGMGDSIIARVRMCNPKFELECKAVDLSDEASINGLFDKLVTTYLANTISTLGNNIDSVEEGRRQLGFLTRRFSLHTNETSLLPRNASSNRNTAGRLVDVFEKNLNEFLAVVKGICRAGPLTEYILKEIDRLVLIVEGLRKKVMSRDMALKWQSIWREVNETVVDNLDKKVADPEVMHCAQQSEFIEDYYTVRTRFGGFWVSIAAEKKYVDICKTLRTEGLPRKAALKRELLKLGEWRPRNHRGFPAPYRAAMRTLGLLAKARTSHSEPVHVEDESSLQQ